MECDQCHRHVPVGNDAGLFDAMFTGDPFAAIGKSTRHLLPVIEGGETVCAGDTSRAQYLEGQPRDGSGSYPYDPDLETRARGAYRVLQEIQARAQ